MKMNESYIKKPPKLPNIPLPVRHPPFYNKKSSNFFFSIIISEHK